MKRIISILPLLLLAFNSTAQDSAESREILDKTYNRYIASDGITLSFSSESGQLGDTNLYPQDGVAFIKGNMFRIEMDDMDIWFNGTTQWVLLKEVEEVNISNPTKNELVSVSPLALLGIYKDGFHLKAPVSKKINGKNVFLIDMVPVTANSDIKKISVAIDKTTNQLVQVLLTTSNDLLTKIDITDYNDNYNFNDSEFVFNKNDHPNVEIVDLR